MEMEAIETEAKEAVNYLNTLFKPYGFRLVYDHCGYDTTIHVGTLYSRYNDIEYFQLREGVNVFAALFDEEGAIPDMVKAIEGETGYDKTQLKFINACKTLNLHTLKNIHSIEELKQKLKEVSET